jgi:hypothetical protein
MLKPLRESLGGWMPSEHDRGADPVGLLGAAWADIVGDEVARNSQPSRIAEAMLVVTTRSSAWSQQLSFLSDTIVAAIRARLPAAGVERLRFRVGPIRPSSPRPAPALHNVVPPRRASTRPPTQSAQEAIARFKEDVTHRQRAKSASGWKECEGCGMFIAPGIRTRCMPCENARAQRLETMLARLLFEAPWLGHRAASTLVDGLREEEYGAIRARLLARWWEILARALASNRLSRDGRERLIASSYVILKSQLPPERIVPATVRNVLGDELHDLIYGTEHHRETNVE